MHNFFKLRWRKKPLRKFFGYHILVPHWRANLPFKIRELSRWVSIRYEIHDRSSKEETILELTLQTNESMLIGRYPSLKEAKKAATNDLEHRMFLPLKRKVRKEHKPMHLHCHKSKGTTVCGEKTNNYAPKGVWGVIPEDVKCPKCVEILEAERNV